MFQITEEKKEKLTDMCNKMLHYGGKIMQCLESLEEGDEEMGMRDEYDDEIGMRDGGRSGSMGMRGMRSGTGMRGGRYGRF